MDVESRLPPRAATRVAIILAWLLPLAACTRGTATGGFGEGATFGPTDGDDGGSSTGTSGAVSPGETAGENSGEGDSGGTTTGSVQPATDSGETTLSVATSESTDDSGDSTDGTTAAAQDLIDLSGYVLLQTDSDRELELPPGTVVPVGGYVVVGRDATADAFADFWGIVWADDVVYVSSQDALPIINGDETFTLLDPGGALVDGPSVALVAGTALTRLDAEAAASDANAWQIAQRANRAATPGSGADVGGSSGVPYIAEIADATGNGNFPFEFVEIRVAP